MAIIIEEEKRKSNIIGMIGWLAFFSAIIAAIYYLFFVSPDLTIMAPPAGLASTTPISAITLHPEDIANNQTFQSLKQYVFTSGAQTSAVAGRANPFLLPQ